MRSLSLVLCTMILTCTLGSVHAQTVEREVISAFGSDLNGAVISITSTAGEVLTETLTGSTSGSFHLTQGYHQPTQKELSVTEKVLPTVKYTLYPNPANDQVTLRLEGPDNTDFRFVIYSVSGQVVAAPVVVTTISNTYEHQFNLSAYAPGNYYLTISSAEGQAYETIPFTKN